MRTDQHPVCQSDQELLESCQIDRYRGSGPGGQNRNKLETAIRLTHRPTGVSVTATERRSQQENLQNALFRLRLALACKIRMPTYTGRAPNDLWIGRRSPDGRLAVNEHHPDFPLLLAEAMDFLSAEGWQPSAAGTRLGVTASQLIKLLQKEPLAFATLNREREKLGLGAMR